MSPQNSNAMPSMSKEEKGLIEYKKLLTNSYEIVTRRKELPMKYRSLTVKRPKPARHNLNVVNEE